MTNWAPDTCECEIENYYLPEAKFLVQCSRHAGSTPEEVMSENRLKNIISGYFDEAAIPVQLGFDKDGVLCVRLPQIHFITKHRSAVEGLAVGARVLLTVEPLKSTRVTTNQIFVR